MAAIWWSIQKGPLTTDWNSNKGVTEPLRTYQEENWSQWLAHLLHSAPPEFLTNLFGEDYDRQPNSVEREVYLPDREGTSRYADIVLFYKDRGLSIEVKKGDKHYSKTIDTASLIESHYAKDWEHVLLLPKYKSNALRRSFTEELEDSDKSQLVIRSDESKDIKVLYWREISSAIREELQSDSESDPHWDASDIYSVLLSSERLLDLLRSRPWTGWLIQAT